MNIEHFTEKAREAISDAAQLARQHNHAQVEVEHLLAALLVQEGGVVQRVIAKAGGNLAAAQRIVNDALERLPQAYDGSEPRICPRLRKRLEDAWRHTALEPPYKESPGRSWRARRRKNRHCRGPGPAHRTW